MKIKKDITSQGVPFILCIVSNTNYGLVLDMDDSHYYYLAGNNLTFRELLFRRVDKLEFDEWFEKEKQYEAILNKDTELEIYNL